MNHHVPCSGVPPDDLLDLIYHYKALLIRQLHLWFAGRETAVDHLLRRLEQAETVPVSYPGMPDVKINTPVVPVYLEEVTVETFGVEYGEPERLHGVEKPHFWPAIWR